MTDDKSKKGPTKGPPGDTPRDENINYKEKILRITLIRKGLEVGTRSITGIPKFW